MTKEPSPEEKRKRRFVDFTADAIKNASNTEYPGVYPGEDAPFTLATFKRDFIVELHNSSAEESSFSLIGIDASIANAFRRILNAEVPTLAISNCYFKQNTSVITDEIMAHRLGLIPLCGSKQGLAWLKPFIPATEEYAGSKQTDYNTIVLKLHVKCEWLPLGKALYKTGVRDARQLYKNGHVYAKQIEWESNENQLVHFSGPDGAVRAANPNILIAKMRPGEEINVTMHCRKGKGEEHAKFSPVSVGTYRLMPCITITKPIIGADAKKFARCFPKGVIKLETISADMASEDDAYKGHEDEVHAVVDDVMIDTVSRECLRHEEFKEKVKLGRIQDHFIYKIESTGQLESNEIFLNSVKILKDKCEKAKTLLKEL